MKFSQHEIDRLRHDVSITSVVGQFVMWDKRKSVPAKGDMWACCPFHGEKSPSFHADDRKGIYHCFGCGKTGDIFKFLQEKTGCSFPEAIEKLGGKPDELVDPAERARLKAKSEKNRAEAIAKQEDDERNIRESARTIWRETVPLLGTLGEQYFRHRGIEFAFDFPALRFHGALRYRDRNTGDILGRFPAVVAGMQGPGDEFLGVWRIYLDPDGRKNSTVPDPKLGLGAYTKAGGAVRLGDPNGRANVVEGIETGFGVYGITGGEPVLCALNTSGMVNLQPPPDTSSLLIWPDGDVDRIRTVDGKERKVESPGHAAAKELTRRMREVEFPCAVQPTPKNGADYLDVWNRMNKRLRKNG